MSKAYARRGNLHAKGDKVEIQINTGKFEWEYVGHHNGIQIDLDEDTNESMFGWLGEVN